MVIGGWFKVHYGWVRVCLGFVEGLCRLCLGLAEGVLYLGLD